MDIFIVTLGNYRKLRKWVTNNKVLEGYKKNYYKRHFLLESMELYNKE